ncbi:SH3 domain-containing protein [Peribacillus sp. NPDC097264]|uniref:SH3 domain-containing protein n=1 Tax=Peribacillus sp. NPDC097264 TaxID=3390616 RepID=UPI003D06E75F
MIASGGIKIKRVSIVFSLSILMVLLTVLTVSIQEVGAKTKTATVSSSKGLAVFTGADKSCLKNTKCKYEKVGTLKNKTKVTVYKENVNGWAQINYKNKKRFINNAYLRYYSTYSKKNINTIFKKIQKAQVVSWNDDRGKFTRKEIMNRLGGTHTVSYIENFIAIDMVKDRYSDTYQPRENYRDDSLSYQVEIDISLIKTKQTYYIQGTSEYLTVSYNTKAWDSGDKIIPSSTTVYKFIKKKNTGWKIDSRVKTYQNK